jgi:transposase
MRLRIEAILWILRTGSPWRDLPPSFGRWKSVYDRFRAWTGTGLWTAIWDALSARVRDDEYLMIDSTAMRVHGHGANPAGGQLAQAMGRSKASLSTKVHMAVTPWAIRWDSSSLEQTSRTSTKPNHCLKDT